MKKIILTFTITFIFVLASCANKESAITQPVRTDQSIAISTYLATGFLSSSNNNTIETESMILTNKVLTTSDSNNPLIIESELNQIQIYFNKLKPFIDHGLDSAITINESTSSHASYDKELSYTIDGNEYTIYYSLESLGEDEDENEQSESEIDLEEEQEFVLNGMMLIDDVEYTLVGEKETENNESEMWFETIDDETNNSVYVEVSNEEDEHSFSLETSINGVEQSIEFEFESEEDETEIELEFSENDVEHSYELEKVIKDNQTIYELEYSINNTEGKAIITEEKDSSGSITYKYSIEEDGKTKEFEVQN